MIAMNVMDSTERDHIGGSMRRYLYVGIGIVIAIVVTLGTIIARIQWANSVPSRPKSLPATAIWVPAPPAPLDFSPRGYWLACWLDAARKVDQCKLTDYKGNPSFEADYSSLTGPNPVAADRLHLRSVSSEELWAPAGQELVPIAHLQDGTVMVPAQDLPQLRERYATK
jgi:hypothetical protein